MTVHTIWPQGGDPPLGKMVALRPVFTLLVVILFFFPVFVVFFLFFLPVIVGVVPVILVGRFPCCWVVRVFVFETVP